VSNNNIVDFHLCLYCKTSNILTLIYRYAVASWNGVNKAFDIKSSVSVRQRWADAEKIDSESAPDPKTKIPSPASKPVSLQILDSAQQIRYLFIQYKCVNNKLVNQ